jgi:eukaryotic-like serine/threonine-protein kinase
MARFEREARLLAALNHPNIAAIYELEDSGDVRALVMEFVEGATLADRIAKRELPFEETLAIAGQIADGLEYAHERGIVHRDLKPANIKLTPEGKIKILDFGLAKAFKRPLSLGNLSNSQTVTVTVEGLIVGTPAYMAPDQACGTPVDKRADIWAFGIILYEMLTGRRPFGGATSSEILAEVLKSDPVFDKIPGPIRVLVRQCLVKDPKLRLRDIGDAQLAIHEAAEAPSIASVQFVPRKIAKRVFRWVWLIGAVIISFGLL